MFPSIMMAPPAAGGSAAWSLLGSWTYSADVANVDFTSLASAKELLVLIRGISASVSGNRLLNVSTDGGSTFPNTSGDYVSLTTAGVESNSSAFAFHGVSSTAARSGAIYIPNAGLSGAPKIGQGLTAGETRLFVNNTNPINALRVSNFGGGNLQAGSIYVMGR